MKLTVKGIQVIRSESTSKGPDPTTTVFVDFPGGVTVEEFFGDFYLSDSANATKVPMDPVELDRHLTRLGLPTMDDVADAYSFTQEDGPEEPKTGWDARP